MGPGRDPDPEPAVAALRPTFMDMALALAREAERRDEVPVGAIVVRGTRVVAAAHNAPRECSDPTAHAEILVIREACRILGSERLTDCDLYVTLEPCAMCAAAISFSRMRRLYYGATDPKGGAVESGIRFFSQQTCHHRPDVYSGIGADEAGAILRNFFARRR